MLSFMDIVVIVKINPCRDLFFAYFFRDYKKNEREMI